MKLPTTLEDVRDDRGQVGIGVLIIFIALVLVAAVAAGVLINTSGMLQSQAEDTGADAQAQVSNQIQVVSATGTAIDIDGDSTNDAVGDIELVVKKSAGSESLDLSRATIQYTSDTASATLNSSDFNVTGDNVLDDGNSRATITVDAATLETSGGLSQGEEAELQIVDQSGASTIYGVNVPDVLSGKTYVRV
jgi:flagellin-like protein